MTIGVGDHKKNIVDETTGQNTVWAVLSADKEEQEYRLIFTPEFCLFIREYLDERKENHTADADFVSKIEAVADFFACKSVVALAKRTSTFDSIELDSKKQAGQLLSRWLVIHVDDIGKPHNAAQLPKKRIEISFSAKI